MRPSTWKRAGVGGVLVAPRVADGHPGRDAEAAGHGGEGAGELLAVADAVVEEGVDGALALTGGHVGAVGEAAVLPEEGLQGQGLLVVRGGARGGLPGDALGLGAEPVGELE